LLCFLLRFSSAALESFEVPLLIGRQENLQTLTTAIYQSMHTGFSSEYGEASAFAVLLSGSSSCRLPLLSPHGACGSFRDNHRQRLSAAAIEARANGASPLAFWLFDHPFVALARPCSSGLGLRCWPVYKPPSFADFRATVLRQLPRGLGRSDTLAGLTNSAVIVSGARPLWWR